MSGFLESVADVCEIEVVSAPGAEDSLGTPRQKVRPDVLIEVPHGASLRRHFQATIQRLEDDYPSDLEQFFFVNTDVGAIECARWIARMMTNPGAHPELQALQAETGGKGGGAADWVLIVRGLVPRTFVDLNRVIDAGAPNGSADAAAGSSTMTPGLGPYVTSAADRETLVELHARYQELASRAYELVLGSAAAGLPRACGIILHTYAPRSVSVDRVDGGIVAALRRAYEPEAYARLPRRPAVDLITTTAGADGGIRLAPALFAAAVRDRYERIGIEVGENQTYRLGESTMGYVRSAQYPQRLLCLEISRELLVEDFRPFEEMSISEAKVRCMAAPIAAAFLSRSGRLKGVGR